MRFTLFKNITFEVSHPVALIEAYCFQSDFYKNYDLLLRQGDRRIEDVNEIGARIHKNVLSLCKTTVQKHKDLHVFRFYLDSFLDLKPETRNNHIKQLSQLIKELVSIKGVGFSKATKILHTLWPRIIPIIDNNLRKKFKEIKQGWKKGNWDQLFMEYYDNFLVGNTYSNLCKIHNDVSHLGLTKIRVFDILWWSYLKAKKLKKEKGICWKMIRGSH